MKIQMLTRYPNHFCEEPEKGNQMGSSELPEEQLEMYGAAVVCLETKVNWCAAIRDEWLFTYSIM
jgi:hypothetical protein